MNGNITRPVATDSTNDSDSLRGQRNKVHRNGNVVVTGRLVDFSHLKGYETDLFDRTGRNRKMLRIEHA